MQSYDRSTSEPGSRYTDGVYSTYSSAFKRRQQLAVGNSGVTVNGFANFNPFSWRRILVEREFVEYNSWQRPNVLSKWVHTRLINHESYNAGSSYRLSPAIPPDYGRTLDRCMEKIYDQIRGKSNLIVDMAESSATLRMLKGTLNFKKFLLGFFDRFVPLPGKSRRQRRAYELAKRRREREKRTRGQSDLDWITSKWLEVRYGWQPLVSSIYDAFETLASSKLANEHLIQARSGSSSNLKRTVANVVEEFILHYRTEVGILFDLDPAKQIHDWTSLDPLRIAWELTPLSFVADWVMNISQQLELLENRWLFASRFRKGYQTNSCLELGTHEVPYKVTQTNENLFSSYKLRTKSRYTELNRVSLAALPYASGLRLEVSFGSKRQLDAAALVHQLVAKRLRF